MSAIGRRSIEQEPQRSDALVNDRAASAVRADIVKNDSRPNDAGTKQMNIGAVDGNRDTIEWEPGDMVFSRTSSSSFTAFEDLLEDGNSIFQAIDV